MEVETKPEDETVKDTELPVPEKVQEDHSALI
jgi:hypothetical protein